MLISCFHVYRPLTPPYVPFGIRRFLFWIPFEVRIQQTAVACSTEIIRGSSHVHNRCTTYSPITLTISPLTCVIFFDTTFPEVLYSGLGEFPSLPYTHTYSPPYPFVCFNAETFHFSEVVVSYPPFYVLFQLLLSLLVTPSVAPTRQFL